MSYNIPRPGDIRRNNDGSYTDNDVYAFSDNRFDGKITSTMYTNGLGQLTDGVIGSDQLEEVTRS